MELFTSEIIAKLEENGKKSGGRLGHVPVVKIFGGPGTWLIAEYTPGDPDHLFGLCDLGMGFPEMGYVSRGELEGLRIPPFGLPLERDLYFTGKYPLVVYRGRRSRGTEDH